MGYHYRERYREGILALEHHAITIEGNLVIHFTNYDDFGTKLDRTSILVQSFDKIKSPKYIPYSNDNDINQRLLARNRAVAIYALGKNFNGYNFFTNNREHFATWCKTGEREGSQIRKGWIDLGMFALTALTKRPNRYVIDAFKRYFIK